ncbi:MAG: hypothetical protein JNM72_21955 [Deltaproteobacteria bacterium]|nr:hypothetical protein [Deltaproteobacteria bacterium]
MSPRQPDPPAGGEPRPETLLRAAVLGGDGRSRRHHPAGAVVRVYPSTRYGGNGGLRALEASLRAGGVDLVVLLTRWVGHSASNKIMKLCRQLGVPVRVVR